MTSGKWDQKMGCSWDFNEFPSQVQSGVELVAADPGPGNGAEHGLVRDEGDKMF